MAYREFHFEKTYEAPSTEGFLDDYTRGVSNMFQSITNAQIAKRKAADQFDYDLSEGKFENDQKIFTEYANNVVNRGRQEYNSQGRLSNETQSMMNQGKGWQQQSAIQYEQAKTLKDEILSRDTRDPYYDGQIDLNKLKHATHGDNNEVNFYTRGERLNNMSKTIGGVDSFKYTNYRADYVKSIGAQYREKQTGNPNASKTIYDQATFWDNGKPGVSDQQAIDYINSDPQGRVEQYFDKRMSDALSEEIKSMKSSGDPRVAWMKDKSDADIKNELINDPSKNIINSKDYGVRKREMVKKDLSEADRINSKVSIDYKADKNNSGGLYKNDNIVHSYAFNNAKIQSRIPVGKVSPAEREPDFNPGPGGVLMQKNGKPITFNSTNTVRTDVNTGQTSRSKIGNIPFNLTGYQMQAFQSNGDPILIKGTNTDEMISTINNMPYEAFSGALPDMKVSLQGYTVNQANLLNAANNQEMSLQSRIAQAKADNKPDEVMSLEMQLMDIQSMRTMVGSGIDDQELALAASRSGIKSVQVNELVQATDTDLANIKAITQGFDLKNPEYWNNDMKRVSEVWSKRYKEAQAAGFKSGAATSGKPKAKPAMISPDEFNSKWATLKSGESLVGPDGVTYTKK